MGKFLFQSVLLVSGILVALFLFKENFTLTGLPFLPEQSNLRQLQVNNAMLKVEIADTQAKRTKGLGSREALASDEGMLFVFPKADRRSFWMKGLTFPLDFVWIRGDLVVDIFQNIQPPTPGQSDESLPIYQSKEDIDKVLEVTGGTVQRLNIKAGDTIKLN